MTPDLRCPSCGQPVNILTSATEPVTDPKTGLTHLVRKPLVFCPSPFHLVVPDAA